MAREIINVGASANDGTGDPIRNCWVKVNNMTNEIYTAIGDGTLIGSVPTISGTPAVNQIALWLDDKNVEGDANLTWDGSALVVTGDVAVTGSVTATGLVSGSNFVNESYVYLEVDQAFGLANPVDPIAGDPFDSIESAFAWVTANYLNVNILEIGLIDDTYSLASGLNIPSNVSTLSIYGGTEAGTILELVAPNGIFGNNSQALNLFDLTVSFLGSGTSAFGSCNFVGVTINMPDSNVFYVGNIANPYLSDVSCLFQNVAINATVVTNAPFYPFRFYGSVVEIRNDFDVTVNNTFSSDGLEGGSIFLIIDGSLNLNINALNPATINIVDQLGGAPTPGTILVSSGNYIASAATTFTSGSIVVDNGIEWNNGDATLNVAAQIISVTSSRALVLSDRSNILEVDTTGGVVTLTIPTNASVAYPVGTKIDVVLLNIANAANIAGDTGVTLNGVSAGSGAITATAYSQVTIYKRGTDDWIVYGDIGVVA